MGLKKNSLFLIIFVVTISVFSFIAYQPQDVIIGGPSFPQIEYFNEELDIISKELGIAIEYKTYSDIETFLIENPDHNLDLALIPNPQGVVNLGQRGIAVPVDELSLIHISEPTRPY